MSDIKLIYGDAYKLIKGLPNKSVKLIITDPPYRIEGLSSKPHGIFGVDGHTRKYESEMLESNLGEGIDYSILDEFCRVLKNIYIYIYGATKSSY